MNVFLLEQPAIMFFFCYLMDHFFFFCRLRRTANCSQACFTKSHLSYKAHNAYLRLDSTSLLFFFFFDLLLLLSHAPVTSS